MVELQESPYDSDFIPFADAAIVTFDDELSSEQSSVPTAQSLSSTTPHSSSGSHPASFQVPPTQPRSPTMSAPQATAPQEQAPPTTQQAEAPNISRAAAAGGAVIGLLFGGPFMSFLLGYGAHHYSKQEGATGDCARALGEVALVARDKFRQVNDRHHLVDKGKEAATRTFDRVQDRVQQADQEHQIKERLGYLVSRCYAYTLDFVYRHRLIERATEKFSRLLEHLTVMITEHHNQMRDRPQQQEESETRENRNRQHCYAGSARPY